MKLIIDDKQVSLTTDLPNAYILGTTQNALGNLISMLNEEFADIKDLDSAEYAEHIVSSLFERTKRTKEIFGLKCTVDVLFNINSLLNDSERWCEITKKGIKQKGEYKINLTMQDVEIWRVRHHITKSVIPIDWLNIDYSKGLIIENVTSLFDVFYGLLYYYAFNGLKLVKCEHCGRWFATTSFKIIYCPRNSTIEGYTHLNCEQAVRNIKYQCSRKKNRIETKAYNAIVHQNPSKETDEKSSTYSYYVLAFNEQCDYYIKKIESKHTAESLSEYMCFLDKVEKEREWLNNGNSK